MKNKLFAIAILCVLGNYASAQTGGFSPTDLEKNGQKINTVTTAVPFLRINPDARAGGMGDVGVATPTDVNGVFSNPAKMAFIEKDYGFAVSFTPWLKALVNDIYLAGITGYYKVKEKQTIQFSLKYFSLGNINFTDENGQSLGDFKPHEFSIDAGYSRRLGNNFALGASIRFIYSNLTNVGVGGVATYPGMAGAADISWMYQKNFKKDGAKMSHDFLAGMNISNIGNKITYTRNAKNADYIPTNLGIGLGYTLNVSEKNAVGVYFDVNRLLVPTPQPTTISSFFAADSGQAVRNPQYDNETGDGTGDGIADWKQKSPIGGIFTSFADAPGILYKDENGNITRTKGSRSKEELRETAIAFGLEYMYNKQFGVRFGYFYEPRTKGNRQFLTAGLTVKYSIVGLNFSYLIPTSIQRNPLDNTLRFSLLFDFKKGGLKSNQNNSGISLVDDTPKKKKVKGEKTDENTEKELKPVENKEPKKLAPIESE